MKITLKRLSICLASAGMLTIYGCGGGGDSAATAASPTALTGTAAVGAALPNAKVTMKGANDKTSPTITADANGAYSFSVTDLSGLDAPLMLQAKGTAGGVEYTLHSILMTVPAAGVSGVLNVTPATDAVVAQAMGTDPATAFADKAQIKAIDATKLSDAKKKLIAALTEVLTALKLDPAKVDLFSTAFAANNAGLDKLLDVIQFQHSDGGAGKKTISVTEKSSGISTPITTDAKEVDVKTVTPPSKETLALDTAAIKNFLSAFNALTTSKVNIQSDAMKALFDDDYLSDGNNKTTQLTDLADNAVGVQMLDYVLQGCDGEKSICKGEITLQKADKTTERFGMPIKLGTDGKWRAYGNRSPFDYGFKPVVQANYGVANDTATLKGSVQTGFNFWFSGVVGNNQSRTYSSAKLLVSDNGTDWTLVAKLKPNSYCHSDFLPIDDSTNPYNCSNFQAVSDEAATASNSARAAGKLHYTVVAYTTADYTGTPTPYVARVKQDLFTQATGSTALASSPLGITLAELGSNSVSFTGNPDSLNIWAETHNPYSTGNTGWGSDSIPALGGKATVAAANARCLKYGGTTVQCDASYGSSAKINSIFLGTRDAQGRGIWKNFSGIATAAITAPVVAAITAPVVTAPLPGAVASSAL